MASSSPFSSSTDSPFIRRATTKAASWAGVASPARTSSMAARAVCSSSLTPATRVVEDRGPAAELGELTHAAAQADRRRWRMIRRRSRSVEPPHTPCFSRRCSACSRQAVRTPQAAADRLRALRLLVGLRVEDGRVQPLAGPQLPPVDFLYRHGSPPKRRIKKRYGSPHVLAVRMTMAGRRSPNRRSRHGPDQTLLWRIDELRPPAGKGRSHRSAAGIRGQLRHRHARRPAGPRCRRGSAGGWRPSLCRSSAVQRMGSAGMP